MSGPSVGGTHLPRQVWLLVDGHGRRLDAWTETNDQYTGVVRVARTWR